MSTKGRLPGGAPNARCPALALVIAAVLATSATVAAGGPQADPQLVTALREEYALRAATDQAAVPSQDAVDYPGAVRPAEIPLVSTATEGLRAPSDLYRGLLPSGNQFWRWTSGGSELVYWVLDDGGMGPAAEAVGGGHVTQMEFSFGLHADVPNDVLRPCLFVTFYNAPPDPVVYATNPVVEPPTPVQSIQVLFAPITLGSAGFWNIRSGLLDLAAVGLDFDLDDTFYVEVLPAEWSSYPAGGPVLDPDVHAVFTGPGTVTYGVNQNNMWSDRWVRPSSCAGSVSSNNDGYYQHPAEMDACNDATFRNQSGIILRGLECTGANKLRLSIAEPTDICVKPGDTVTVTLSQSCLPGLVRGYQAFLSFDQTRLTFDSGAYLLPLPYGLPIIVPIAASGNNIDLAAGIDNLNGQTPTSVSADLAVLTFTAGMTPGITNVGFRSHDPATRFSDPYGVQVIPTLIDSQSVCVDGTPPTIACPPDVSVQCVTQVPAPATNYAEFVAQGGTASDAGCGSTVTVTHEGDTDNGGAGCPGDPLIIARTYRATDCAGNYAECTQEIVVKDNTPPTITQFPADQNLQCVGQVPPPNVSLVQATDNCAGAVTITHQGETDNGGGGCPGDPLVVTRTYRATDICGNFTDRNQAFTVIDNTPPVIACPGPATVECDDLGLLLGAADGGVLVTYNNYGPEHPANQAFFRAQFSQANPNGAVFNFDTTPLFGGPSWYNLFQVHPDQFGLDFTLPAPTYNGVNPPLTWFHARDNVNGSCAGATDAGAVAWAISGYIPSPSNPAGCVVNSVLRSNGLDPASILITSWVLTPPSGGGTIWTADVAGYLVSDGLIHWYNPATPHSPTKSFGMTGTYCFVGTLEYDSLGDPGNDGDFYAGSIWIYANSLTTTWGVATATDNCDPAPVITYSDGFVPGTCGHTGTITRTWRATDRCGNFSTCTQTITVDDVTAPTFTSVPANRTVNADAGGCTAVLVPPMATATAVDNCDPAPTVTFVRSDGQTTLPAPYPSGTTTITWTARDCTGNTQTAVTTVTVNAVNEMLVTVQLSPNIDTGAAYPQTLGRCVVFELWQCSPLAGPVAVPAVLNFTVTKQPYPQPNCAIAATMITVPCGSYSCITARDPLHTLRRTDEGFVTVGTQYVADFTGDPTAGGDWLIGGNLNADKWIDILDFGVFSFQWAMYFGTGNTTCSTTSPHSDISGDGRVTTADFTFIQQNFLQGNEPNCCGQPSLRGDEGDEGPVSRIAVSTLRHRGLAHLAVADLNRDGWLDAQDIAAFLAGARPAPAPQPVEAVESAPVDEVPIDSRETPRADRNTGGVND